MSEERFKTGALIKMKGALSRHSDFAVFWSKLPKYLTKNLFSTNEIALRTPEGKYEMISPRENWNSF